MLCSSSLVVSVTVYHNLSLFFHMQNSTQITEEEYLYALECLPPIYPSKLGKEYLTDCLEYDSNSKPGAIHLTGIFQNSEPTKHENFWKGINEFISKPVYATYFIYDDKRYRYNHDMQNLSIISF